MRRAYPNRPGLPSPREISMPSFLIATTFLGQPCGWSSSHGANPEMHDRLHAADEAVKAIYDALTPGERVDPSTGRAGASFSQWAGTSRPHTCWRPNVVHHAAGAAIDLEPAANPRIATHGPVLAVYDRAVQFMTLSGAADVRERQPGESTASVWARFKAVSDALASYVRFAVDADSGDVSRAPIEDADERSDDEILAGIPADERRDAGEAVEQLEAHLGSAEFRARHPSWAATPRAQYLRILRDYELVRAAIVIDCADAVGSRTANPARGFLQLRSEIVTALCDQGLRWGACDLDTGRDGAAKNGAMMHFELADDGGYPEIHSLLRFG
jgi:hypothetical protein